MNSNNDNLMTVADLKAMLDKVPDDTTLWVFTPDLGTFQPVWATTHDKRVTGFNFWVQPLTRDTAND
jgi:hypothetical protein